MAGGASDGFISLRKVSCTGSCLRSFMVSPYFGSLVTSSILRGEFSLGTLMLGSGFRDFFGAYFASPSQSQKVPESEEGDPGSRQP